MRRVTPNPQALAIAQTIGDQPLDEAWVNDIYDCQVRYLEERGRAGMLHLSVKRLDRDVIRDWRHLQSIKNEVCGWEREAFELLPAESRLVDGANQTHLWVLAAGEQMPIGFAERSVATDEEMRAELEQRGIDPAKARQRPWQPGLSTGPDFRPPS